MAYKLDKDGYVVIIFVDQFNQKVTLSEEESSSSEDDRVFFTKETSSSVEEEVSSDEETSISWNEAANVDPDFADLVNSEKLTKKNILNVEMTDLVRGAHYNEYLEKCILDYLGFRPLPLKTRIYNSECKLVDCKLFPHQVKALTFMREREATNPRLVYGLRGGIIKMDMGLGKSLTAITHSLISVRPPCEEKYGENGFPTLIIASRTVMMEWKSQGFEKFFGKNVKVLYLHGDYLGKSINTITRQMVAKYDFVITTYDVCSSVCREYKYHEDSLEIGDEHSLMNGKVIAVHCRTRQQSNRPGVVGPSIIYTTPFERVICDESQKFCNPDTKTYHHIMAVYGRYKWCLTGTPIKNVCTDIWTQLRFCGYTGVEKKTDWKRGGYQKMQFHNLTKAILNIDYGGACVKIPPKYEYEIFVSLDSKEQECYDCVSGIAKGVFHEMDAGLVNFASILALLTRLRQCSIAPYLLTKMSKREKGTIAERKKDKEAVDMLKDVYKGTLGGWLHDKEGTAGIRSKKMTQTVDTISKIPEKEKVLIFSMFTSVLDLLADAVNEFLPDFGFVQIDGDIKGLERAKILDDFRRNDKTRGLLITYKVGSEGLNLTEANHVILVEPWWCNSIHSQAKSRCHRTGQKKNVEVHNIYVQNSVEERIIEICKGKEEMAASMMEGTSQVIKRGVGLDKFTLGRILGVYD